MEVKQSDDDNTTDAPVLEKRKESKENVIRCPLGCPFSEETVKKCPQKVPFHQKTKMGNLTGNENVIKCPLALDVS